MLVSMRGYFGKTRTLRRPGFALRCKFETRETRRFEFEDGFSNPGQPPIQDLQGLALAGEGQQTTHAVLV